MHVCMTHRKLPRSLGRRLANVRYCWYIDTHRLCVCDALKLHKSSREFVRTWLDADHWGMLAAANSARGLALPVKCSKCSMPTYLNMCGAHQDCCCKEGVKLKTIANKRKGIHSCKGIVLGSLSFIIYGRKHPSLQV
jgi:hypothetical protein